MSGRTHEAAGHDLPAFIVAPGETDVLFVVIVWMLLAIVLSVGIFYFKLHALPERMAHSANSTQLQLVGVLALLALFTHNNIFWVAALLLAAVRLPDFSTPLNAIAESLTELSKRVGPADRPVAIGEAAGSGQPEDLQDISAPAQPAPLEAEAPSTVNKTGS